MRTDIKINTELGELVFTQSPIGSKCQFRWLSESDTHIFGEVILPSYLDKNSIYNGVINVTIPYTPIYKPIRLSIKKQSYDGDEYCLNPRNNSIYFDVYAKLYGEGKNTHINASQLLLVGIDEYLISVDEKDGACYIYNGLDEEIQTVSNANIQNRNLLLRCVPSNSYRYPISGVGLIRYLNANINDTDLAITLQREFEEDGVRVKNAAFDSNTGEIDIDLDFGDENI